MEAGFEVFDHTADLGLHLRAPTFEGLIDPATQALYSLIGNLAACGPEETIKLDFSGDDRPGLLRAYMAELLRLFETSQRIVVRLRVKEYSSDHLRVVGSVLRVDPDASIYAREVKAITYHELDIRPIQDGFEATVIVDI